MALLFPAVLQVAAGRCGVRRQSEATPPRIGSGDPVDRSHGWDVVSGAGAWGGWKNAQRANAAPSATRAGRRNRDL